MAEGIVIVTGASGRLGRVICAQLADGGARVAAVDRDEPLGIGDLGVAADLTDAGSVEAAWSQIESELGTPTGLIHTVGMWAGKPLHETDVDAWETVLRVNLTSAFLAFGETIRRMLANGSGGTLVGITSAQGADCGTSGQAAYSAAKAGVMRLVESTAAEYHDHRISAVAVAPSTILFGDEKPDAKGVTVEDVSRLCVRLATVDGAVHSGATIRAYGSAG